MTTIGPYQLGGLLGAGGMGSVFRAVHAELRVEVALKLLPRSTRPGFEGEVAALAALTHPGIVQIVDCGVLEASSGAFEAGTPWIAMEALGADLATAPPPPERLLETLRQALAALAHAHGAGLLHLDIKPSNLLWRDEQVVLADFGLARRDPAGISHFSELFAAPEQLADGPTGPWTDLYGLGRSVERWRTGSDGLDAWLERAAAPSPAHRFASAAEALAALPTGGTFAAGAPGGTAPTRAAPTRRRDPTTPDASTPQPMPTVAWLDPSPSPPPPVPVRPLHRGAGLGVVQQRTLPLLGREAQQRALWAALRQVAEERRSRVVALEGPPGSGRSSLASWLAREAHADCGALVLDLPPHDELASALRNAVLRHPLGPACTGLARTWLDGHLPPQLGIRALLDWIGGRLTVLVVDGATAGVAELAEVEAPLLVVTTGPGETWAGVSGIHSLELPPLPDEAIQSALTALLGLDAPTANTLAHTARGLPGIALALVNQALLTGALRSAPHGFTQHGTLDLPSHLTEPMRARLERFPADERAVLAVAAILGPEIDVSVLPEPVQSTLSRALAQGIWRRAGEQALPAEAARWVWTSAVLRQAAIDLDPRGAEVLHRTAAALLPAGLDQAMHLALSGDPDALGPLYEGFKQALGRQDLLAARQAERATHGLHLPPDEVRPALMRARLAWTQNHDQAAWDELATIEPHLPTASVTERNDYLLVKGNLLTNRMQLDDALACYDRIELEEGEPVPCTLAHARSRCLGWLHREQEALQVVEEGLRTSALTPRQRHDLQLVRATTLHTLQRLDEAEQTYRSLLDATPILAYQAASNLADLLRQRGDTDGSRQAYAQAERLAAAAGAELSFATVCAPTLDAERDPARAYARLREAIAATASGAVAAFGHFGCLQCCPDEAAWDEHWREGFRLLPHLPSDPDSVWFMERAREHAGRRGWTERAEAVEAVLTTL